ncbi:MAG: nuclease-related domain-containing protein [Actinomycetales bacterium]
MTGEAVRWRKYGKDRLYVTAADGTKLGHRDLPEQSPEPGTEMPTTGTAEVEDLAQRGAGAMAREQARALKQAAPVRTFVARVLGVHTDERAWRIGADGEEMVAAQLAKLARKDPRWHFLHAIPVGENGADIDHLVVGPGGVYSLNAKHHPGAKVWVGGNTLMINGQRQPYIRNSRFEARRASTLLTAGCGFAVVVTGMVVPVGANDVRIKTPPEDVHVVCRRQLVSWLRARPVVLTDEQVVHIFEVARRSTTWQKQR